MKYIKICFILLIIYSVQLPAREANSENQAKNNSPFDQSKFVPDISFIADISYLSRDLSNDSYSALHIPGTYFPLGHINEDGHSHAGFNSLRGFNFNYGELSLYSIVDPYFDLFAIIHLVPEHAGLEEAYITTRKLPYGFQIKAGKFLSSFGRINEQHTHSWNFTDRPLISNLLFGDEGLNEIGGRITWVAPTNFYLMFGTEILTGDNEMSFGTASFSDPNRIIKVDEDEGPNLFIGYARSAFDIGETALLLGISYAHGSTKAEHDFSSTSGEGVAMKANSNIIGGDFTLKHSFDAVRYLSFQAEYLYRLMDGTYYTRDSMNAVNIHDLEKNQSGFYFQLIGKLGLQWRAGVRYDLINTNDAKIDGIKNSFPENLAKYSAMIEYNPTEFSRLRLQYNHDRSKYLEPNIYKPFSEIILQLNVTIGAHGAHSF